MVESVRDGTTLRVRLFMPDGEHQFVNITLAGARSPRVASKQGETSEPSGDEVSRYRSLTNAAAALMLSSKPSRRNILPNRVYFNAQSKYNFFHYPP
jgi:staphylococcal nuclease domain-containing protein 1